MDVLTNKSTRTETDWSRAAGVAAGVGVHALFVYTVWRLFWFLRDGAEAGPNGTLWVDALLALQFAVPHSVLLYPSVKRRLTKWVPPAFYGLLYTTVTCLSLQAIFAWWRPVGPILWRFDGASSGVVAAAFYASWAALFYSLNLTGLGHQTGLTPWLAWVRGQASPRRCFEPRGAYRWLRHPVYLSFMGLVWFTPAMTLDHAVLTGIWTGYLLVGSWLKDRRLEHYVGAPYREYETRVPGFPLAVVGPLGRRRRVAAVASRDAPIGKAA